MGEVKTLATEKRIVQLKCNTSVTNEDNETYKCQKQSEQRTNCYQKEECARFSNEMANDFSNKKRIKEYIQT